MRLSRGQLFLPADGVFYDQIRLAASFDREKIDIQEAVFRGGNGRLTLDGGVRLNDGALGPVDVTATFKRFVAMDGPRGRVVVDGALALRGTADEPNVVGDLTIPSGVIKLPDFTSNVVKQVTGLERSKEIAETELPQYVFVLTPEGQLTWAEYITGEAEKEEEPFKMDANIRVRINRDVWVQNQSQEVVAEVMGDVRFTMDDGQPRMSGKVETVRGEVKIGAEQLNITQGVVTFTGGAEIDPRLDITAQTNDTEYGVVTMRVQGAASAPRIEFESDQPQYDTADALAIVMIGKPLSESADGGEQLDARLQALSFAAGALTGWAEKQLAEKSPVRFDLLQINAESYSTASLRVGKYVTPRLFLVYKTRLSATDQEGNTHEAQAEYQLTREIYVKSFYGDQSIWGGEVYWKHYY